MLSGKLKQMFHMAIVLFGGLMVLASLLPVEGHASGTGDLTSFKAVDSARPADFGSLEQLASTTKKKRNSCPPGQNRDPNTGVCFSCSHNDHFENGECVPCKEGFHQEGDECVPDAKKKKSRKQKSCPAGTEFRNGKCRKSEFPEVEQCPEGQNPDPATGVCFSCSHNDHFENGRCVPCREGFHVEGDECVAD